MALGFPHPLTVGLDFLLPSKVFGFSLIGGSYKREEGDTNTDAEIRNMEIQARYHPGGEAFFLGLAVGSHVVTVTRTESILTIPVRGEAEVQTTYLTPQLGWVKTWDSGLSVGFQLGWLIPGNPTTSFESDAPWLIMLTPDYADLEREVKEQGDDLGGRSLPFLTLLRVGWMF